LVASGVLGSKNAVQLSATVFAAPVKADPDVVAAGVVAAGAEVVAAAVVAAEVVAGGAEDDELELLHAASATDATTAAHAASDRHLDPWIFIWKQASPL